VQTAIKDKNVEVNLYTTKDNSATLKNGGASGKPYCKARAILFTK
jgi:hypothetical protein